MKKVASLSVITAMLSACVATDPDPSSSSRPSSQAPASSSFSSSQSSLPVASSSLVSSSASLISSIHSLSSSAPSSSIISLSSRAASSTSQSASSAAPLPVSCNSDKVRYGSRKVYLLTSQEYQNSLEDLIGIDFNIAANLPSNSEIDFYANQIFTPIGETYFNAYVETANTVADWAINNGFQTRLNCTSYANCQSAFIDNFLPKIFRRPITNAEQSVFTTLFSNEYSGGELEEALKLVLNTALTSSSFLYRTELGGPLIEEPAFEYDGTSYSPIEPILSKEGAGDITNNSTRKYLNFQFFPEGTLIQITVKAVPVNNEWPIIAVDLGGKKTSVPTNKTENTYKLYIEGQNGYKNIVIGMANAGSANGITRKLYDLSIRASKGQETITPTTTPVLDDDVLELNPFEMAAFLSYTYAGTTPDNTLLEAADRGELDTDEQVMAQIDRLLESPRGKARLGDFVSGWLRVNDIAEHAKDPEIFPEYNAQLRDDMMAELKAFYAHVALNEDFSTLFNANYSFLNKNLSDFYQEGSVSGSRLVKTPTVNRGGLLTSGAFLTRNGAFDSTHLIRRSVAVRERVLCHHLPSPPNDIDDARNDAQSNVSEQWASGEITNRERNNLLTNAGVCAICHEKLINPLGFTLEDFDSIGRFRSTDHHGLNIDAGGTLFGINSVLENDSLAINGGQALGNSIPSLPTAESCFVANNFRFVVGHGLEKIDPASPDRGLLSTEEIEDYKCAATELLYTLKAQQGKPRELLKKLGTLDLIRYRKQRSH